ncbi:MAG: methylenetetrahydrofolate reductase [Campylobacterota bacterium]|nr:methylenetetrahydrofolate reductase [Campylobacterota bacterium]
MFKELIEKLHSKNYITLETTPPHGAKFSHIIDKIEELELHKKVDGFSTTDNPLAKLKYNSLFAASLLQQRLSKPVIATMSMRDRNKIALQSDLLGANEADVRAILALTGDPAKMSDQPHTKGVVEADSSLLLDIIGCFNSGIDYAGKPLGHKPQELYGFSVMNSHAKNPKTLQKKMQKKIAHKSVGIITQPVYDIENAKMLLNMLDETKDSNSFDTQLIIGLFPITKLRTAQFLASHVPGINVPSYWIEKLRVAANISEKEEYKVGFELSYNLLKKVQELHGKVHLMTANKFDLANDLLT